MWSTGSDDVNRFVAIEILQFFNACVARDPGADPCDLGRSPEGADISIDASSIPPDD